MERIVKLNVMVPVEDEERVRLALGRAGAGRIGRYDYCSFVVKGVGHYRPLPGAKPYAGEEGKIANAEEVQVQTVCYEKDLPRVLGALREAHPYEEIAYDIIPLLNHEYSEHLVRREEAAGWKEAGESEGGAGGSSEGRENGEPGRGGKAGAQGTPERRR